MRDVFRSWKNIRHTRVQPILCKDTQSYAISQISGDKNNWARSENGENGADILDKIFFSLG